MRGGERLQMVAPAPAMLGASADADVYAIRASREKMPILF
jgi:hypothetical protein